MAPCLARRCVRTDAKRVADYTVRVLRPAPRLEEEGTVAFTSPPKAALVTNMMTVLLSETGAQPVVPMVQG